MKCATIKPPPSITNALPRVSLAAIAKNVLKELVLNQPSRERQVDGGAVRGGC